MLIRQMRQNKVIFEVIVFSILNKSFKSEPYLCNECHGIMQKAMNFNDVAIVSAKKLWAKMME